MELEIDEVLEGLGQHAGRAGTLKSVDRSGRLSVGIGGGMSVEQREDFWARRKDIKGTIITVRYNEILLDETNETLTLYLPRFLEERLDKTEADDALKIYNESFNAK